MKTLNVGVVGYGWAATAHIDAIQNTRLGQVTAIYSSRAAELDAADISREYGTPIRLYGDLDEMLADPDLQVIDITSYPSQHKEQALKAAAAGKHLIIEKPLALSLEDCRTIRDAVRSGGVRGGDRIVGWRGWGVGDAGFRDSALTIESPPACEQRARAGDPAPPERPARPPRGRFVPPGPARILLSCRSRSPTPPPSIASWPSSVRRRSRGVRSRPRRRSRG